MAYLYILYCCFNFRWTCSWICMSMFVSSISIFILFLFQGVLMIIDYCVTGTVKDDINNLADDSKDVEDLVCIDNYAKILDTIFFCKFLG